MNVIGWISKTNQNYRYFSIHWIVKLSSSHICSVHPQIQGRQINGLFIKIEEFLCDFHWRSYMYTYVYLWIYKTFFLKNSLFLVLFVTVCHFTVKLPLINFKNSTGSSTLPWGTPLTTSLKVEVVLLIRTHWLRPVKKLLIQFNIQCTSFKPKFLKFQK